MGHFRLGPLPKSRTWQQVIDLIANGAVEIAIEESETAALKYIKTAMTEASV